MTRRARLCLIGFALAVTLSLSACDDEFFSLSDIADFLPTPVATPSTPTEKVVLEAPDILRNMHKAETHLEAGLKLHDLNAIQEAIKLRPYDPTFRYYKAAMQTAYGQRATGADEAIGVLDAVYGEGPDAGDEKLKDYYFGVRDALLRTRKEFPQDSQEWLRLTQTYCGVAKTGLAYGYEKAPPAECASVPLDDPTPTPTPKR